MEHLSRLLRPSSGLCYTYIAVPDINCELEQILKPRTMEGHFHTLGLRTNATDAEVRTAYHSLALKHHPDKAGSSGEELMKDINTAYEAIIARRTRGRLNASTLMPTFCTGPIKDSDYLNPNCFTTSSHRKGYEFRRPGRYGYCKITDSEGDSYRVDYKSYDEKYKSLGEKPVLTIPSFNVLLAQLSHKAPYVICHLCDGPLPQSPASTVSTRDFALLSESGSIVSLSDSMLKTVHGVCMVKHLIEHKSQPCRSCGDEYRLWSSLRQGDSKNYYHSTDFDFYDWCINHDHGEVARHMTGDP